MTRPTKSLNVHNDRVNRCRRYMASTLEFGSEPHPGHLRRRCKSDGWGKRGRDATRLSRLRCMDSRFTSQRRKWAKRPRAVQARRIPWRPSTAHSALRLLCAQQTRKDTP